MVQLTVLLIWVIPYLVAFYTLRMIRGRDNGGSDGPPPPDPDPPRPVLPPAPEPRLRRRPRTSRGPIARARPRRAGQRVRA